MYEGKPLSNKLSLVTLNVAGCIDVFTRQQYCEIIIDKINFCIENRNLFVYEYVLMPSHLKMIAQAEKRHLSKVLRDFKVYTAREILKSISESPDENRKEWLMRLFHFFTSRYQNDAEHHFWQFGNNPVDLDTTDLLKQEATRLINLPVSNKIVDKPQHYIYSSANPRQRVKLSEWH